MRTPSTKTTAVMANCFELWSMRVAGPINCLSAPPRKLGATLMLLGLLVCGRCAYPQADERGGLPHFEAASVEVPVGSNCVLHAEENLDASQSISLRPDADGVVRFLAVRPTLPSSVNRLALDCTDSQGNTNSYPIDLRSEETYAERPFDPLASRSGGSAGTYRRSAQFHARINCLKPGTDCAGSDERSGAIPSVAGRGERADVQAARRPTSIVYSSEFAPGRFRRCSLRQPDSIALNAGTYLLSFQLLDGGHSQWLLQEGRNVRQDLPATYRTSRLSPFRR